MTGDRWTTAAAGLVLLWAAAPLAAGYETLSAGAPKTVAEIEQAMARGR